MSAQWMKIHLLLLLTNDRRSLEMNVASHMVNKVGDKVHLACRLRFTCSVADRENAYLPIRTGDWVLLCLDS